MPPSAGPAPFPPPGPAAAVAVAGHGSGARRYRSRMSLFWLIYKALIYALMAAAIATFYAYAVRLSVKDDFTARCVCTCVHASHMCAHALRDVHHACGCEHCRKHDYGLDAMHHRRAARHCSHDRQAGRATCHPPSQGAADVTAPHCTITHHIT